MNKGLTMEEMIKKYSLEVLPIEGMYEFFQYF